MAKKIILEPSRALAEFRLLPGFTSPDAVGEKVSLETPLVNRPDGSPMNINIPMVAAAMQAVSGARMGIELARQGAVAFVFASQPVDQQAQMIRKIKSHKAGFVKPHTISPDIKVEELHRIGKETGFSTFPVVDAEGRLVGLVTKNDFELSIHGNLPVRERMVPRASLRVGVDISNLRQANEILMESHQPVLPIVDSVDRLLFLVFRKDIKNHLNNPLEVVDGGKRLLCAAAINTHDFMTRLPALVEAGVDLVTIDSSHGHSFFQGNALNWARSQFPRLPIIGGNIVTDEGFRFLVEAGAGAVKIGMGGGSICITQEEKGTGRGLGTAIIEVARERDRFFRETGRYIPLIADGGIVHSKDMAIALALGADSVMLGRYFARFDESPTEKIVINNRVMKPYWGEGSPRAREWRQGRYQQAKFSEGVEGYVEYAGKLRDNLDETLAKLRSSISTCGSATIREFHEKCVVEVVSGLSIREGQVHDIFLPPSESTFHSRSWGV